MLGLSLIAQFGRMESTKHKILKQVALRWVQKNGCVAFACEVMWGFVGIADVVGIKANGDVYLVEAKVSNSDMRSDAKRKFWKLETSNRIDFVYYIIADFVSIGELPLFIGVLDGNGRVSRKAQRRQRGKTLTEKAEDFERIARACSWRAYGYVIRHEKEQLEFAL